MVCLTKGARIGICTSVKNLKDELSMVKPTLFVSVPRLYNKFYDAMKKKISKAGWVGKKVFDIAYAQRLENISKYNDYSSLLSFVFNKTKAVLGGRVCMMITGSAPINADIKDFFRVTMGCPIVEGYG